MNRIKSRNFRALRLLAAVIAPLGIASLVSGCGGGGVGPQVPAATGTYTGQVIVGTNRLGRLVVQTTGDNVAQGALQVTATTTPTEPQPVTLPLGTYPFSGTLNDNNFTATVNSGSPLAGLTVKGTLASPNSGTFQMSGALNGDAYNFTGTLQPGGFVAILSQPQSANLDLSRFDAVSTDGLFGIVNGDRVIQAAAVAQTAASTRTISFSITKGGPFRVGDTLNLNRYPTGSILTFTATGSAGSGTWISHDGIARIDAIDGNRVTISIRNARMEGDPYQLGEFFINGSGVFHLNRPPS